jgi:hypothetical protein
MSTLLTYAINTIPNPFNANTEGGMLTLMAPDLSKLGQQVKFQ